MIITRNCLSGLAGLLALLAGLTPAQSALVKLRHYYSLTQSSVAVIDADSGEGMFPSLHSNQQRFWYRLGESGGESSIHTLSPAVIVQPALNSATLTYTGENGLSLSVAYTLTGEWEPMYDIPVSTISATVSITNNSGQPLHFFQYSDFNIERPADEADLLTFLNETTVKQYGSLFPPEQFLVQAVVTPTPNHRQGSSPFAGDFNDGNPTTLNDFPLIGDTIGPGNLAWANQWDTTATTFTIGVNFRSQFRSPPAAAPCDVNNNQMYDAEDVRGFAFALVDPTGIFPLEGGGFAGDLIAVYDVVDRDEGVIDFDDLAAFAELIAPTFGSLEAAQGMIDDAIETEAAKRVPEPQAWLLLMAGIVTVVVRRLTHVNESASQSSP